MKRWRGALLVLGSLLLTSCFANRLNNAMQSWEGHHYSELITSWGLPEAVYDDGAGGRILVYTKARRWTTPGHSTTDVNATATIYDNMIWANARASTEYVPPQTYGYTAWRMFRIDRRGIIYFWSWRGL